MTKIGLLLLYVAVLPALGCSGGGGTSPEQEAQLHKMLAGPPRIAGHGGHPKGGARAQEKQAAAAAGSQAPAGGQ